MDIKLDTLPFVIYISEDRVRAAIDYDKNFQPTAVAGPSRYRSDCNEAEGKRVRRVRSVLTKYFNS